MSDSEKLKYYEAALGEIKRTAKYNKGIGNDNMDEIIDLCDILYLMEES